MTTSRESDISTRLAATIGADRLVPVESRGQRPEQDLSRYPIGSPLAWVRPRSTAEVASIIRLARESGRPVVPVGQRTAYWNPLRLEGAIALDTGDLSSIAPPAVDDGFITCGAGAHVWQIDETLRATGGMLAAYPDAWGDTSIGSMIATGFSAGLGMATASADTLTTGLRVVLGTGEVLTTGAGFALGAPPAVRVGLPDPTGLFLASDGALGIVTEVAVKRLPHTPATQLTWTGRAGRDGLQQAVELSRRLQQPGTYETLRAVTELRPDTGWGATELDVSVISAAGPDPARQLALGVFPGARIADSREPRPQGDRIPLRSMRGGEAGEHWARLAHHHFFGVDVVFPASAAEKVLEVAAGIAADGRLLPRCASVRWALYFAPGFINMGVHVVAEAGTADDESAARAFVQRGMRALAPLPITPYRWGRLWGDVLGGKLDPTYRSMMRAIKQVCDPDAILHPGASIWGAEP